MKRKTLSVLCVVILVLAGIAFNLPSGGGSDNEPWSEKQLMEPAKLAEAIKAGKGSDYVIFNIGPSGQIRGAINIGDTKEKENLAELGKQISGLKKDEQIVIYCGCCPFRNCPNIRPAFSLLNEKGFKNHKLLNLPQNLKVDWIDKGYPIE